MRKLTFLSHFCICLACGAAAWFGWQRGVFGVVWDSDARAMVAVIAAWFAMSLVWLGALAWKSETQHVSPRFGYVATEMAVILGVLGMAIGLSWQGQHVATQGTAIFAAWAVQLYSTVAGVGSSAVLLLATYNLETGLRR